MAVPVGVGDCGIPDGVGENDEVEQHGAARRPLQPGEGTAWWSFP